MKVLRAPWQALFQAAAADASKNGQHVLWYPHAWLFGYMKSKAELLSEAAAADPNPLLESKSEQLRMAALEVARCSCAIVLRSYRHAVWPLPWPCRTGLHCTVVFSACG